MTVESALTTKHWTVSSDKVLLQLTLLTRTDRLDSGTWDESFIQAFDNESRTFINTVAKLEAFLPILLTLKDSTAERPELSYDCEGCNLGRNGSLTIFQMRIRSLKHTYVFDVLALGGRVMFETEGEEGQSLRKLLQSQQVKVFWDVRQDQDAMWHHFDIQLGGITDAQLMEIASRDWPDRQRLYSLFIAVTQERKAWMVGDEFWEWKKAFKKAKDYFNESNYECFNIRPLTTQALQYSAGDVDCIEKLYDVYLPKMNEKFWAWVRMETQNRIDLSLIETMPVGSNIAPSSIDTIPYEWPPLKEWEWEPGPSNAEIWAVVSKRFATTDDTRTSDVCENSTWDSQTPDMDDLAVIEEEEVQCGHEDLVFESEETNLWQAWPGSPNWTEGTGDSPKCQKVYQWGDPEPDWTTAENW